MLWVKALLTLGCAAAWTVDKGAVAVSGGGDVVDRVAFAKLDGPVELFTDRSLDISFKVPETPLPHQIAVRLSYADEHEGEDALVDKIALAKMRGNNAKVVIPFKAVPAALHNYPLKATALLSGKAQEPVEAALFDLFVYGENNAQLPRRDLTGRGEQLAPGSVIEHVFRGAPRHANPVYAVLFIVAIDVLFTGLFLSWKGTLRPDFALLTQNRARLAVFAVTVLLELAIVGYFIAWSIFQLIAVAAVLLPILFLAASRAE